MKNEFGNKSNADCSCEKICQRMLSLRDRCVHPVSQKPYINTSSGGKDNSNEGQQVRNLILDHEHRIGPLLTHTLVHVERH